MPPKKAEFEKSKNLLSRALMVHQVHSFDFQTEPNPAHGISPRRTGNTGLPSTKQLTISVPPLMDARHTSFLILLYTKSKLSGASGEPVLVIIRTLDRSCVSNTGGIRLPLLFSASSLPLPHPDDAAVILRSASMYLADVPNTVHWSFAEGKSDF